MGNDNRWYSNWWILYSAINLKYIHTTRWYVNERISLSSVCISLGEMVCEKTFWNPVSKGHYWYTLISAGESNKILRLKHVLMAGIKW